MRSSSRLATLSSAPVISSVIASLRSASPASLAGSNRDSNSLTSSRAIGGVRAQHALDVVLAEGDVGLPQVLGVGAEHDDLAPGQLRVQHQRVEAVVLDPAVPQRQQRALDLLPDPLVRDQVDLCCAAPLAVQRRACGAGRSRRSRTARPAANSYGCSSTTSTPMCWSRGSTSVSVIGPAGPVDRQPPDPLDGVRHVDPPPRSARRRRSSPTPTARSRGRGRTSRSSRILAKSVTAADGGTSVL